jgi:hypothetical protein
MPAPRLTAIAGLMIFIVAALMVTQTKERVGWPAWLIPVAIALAVAAGSVVAIAEEGPFGFLPGPGASLWELVVWYNLLMALGAAFYLLQNRARAAGMKSEVWVLLVVFTGGVGLLLMLARTLQLEREQADADRS